MVFFSFLFTCGGEGKGLVELFEYQILIKAQGIMKYIRYNLHTCMKCTIDCLVSLNYSQGKGIRFENAQNCPKTRTTNQTWPFRTTTCETKGSQEGERKNTSTDWAPNGA